MQRYIDLVGVLTCDAIKHMIDSNLLYIESEIEGEHYNVSVYFALVDYVVVLNQRFEYRVSAGEFYRLYSEVKICNNSDKFTDDEVCDFGKAITKSFSSERIDMQLLPKCRNALKTKFILKN